MNAKPNLPPPAPQTRELIRALGGPSRVARQLAISPQAVTNWYRDGVAARHHLRLWAMAQAAGLDWRPPNTEGLKLADSVARPKQAA